MPSIGFVPPISSGGGDTESSHLIAAGNLAVTGTGPSRPGSSPCRHRRNPSTSICPRRNHKSLRLRYLCTCESAAAPRESSSASNQAPDLASFDGFRPEPNRSLSSVPQETRPSFAPPGIGPLQVLFGQGRTQRDPSAQERIISPFAVGICHSGRLVGLGDRLAAPRNQAPESSRRGGYPPRPSRPGRADFPHPVLHLVGSLKDSTRRCERFVAPAGPAVGASR